VAQPFGQVSLDELHRREDEAYARLQQRWRDELNHAWDAGDQARIDGAITAITSSQRQRTRQLVHRADPNEAPF